MSGPEFFQTPMGRQFYDYTMPAIAKALTRIAIAMEEKKALQIAYVFKTEQDLTNWLVKENILKYASEDELFALFHTFKEYMKEHLKGDETFSEGITHVLDRDIGEVIEKLKANYK